MNEVQLKSTIKTAFFNIDVDGKHEAMMTFVFAGEDKIIIDHTEVKPGNEGKGFGKNDGNQSRGICARKRHQNHSIVSFCQKCVR